MTVEFTKNLINELEAMVHYASGKGMTVPPQVIVDLYQIKTKAAASEKDVSILFTPQELTVLAQHHSQMTTMIEPALPTSIAFIKGEMDKRSVFSFLGAVPLARWLSLAAILFLAAMISSAISPHVSSETMNKGLFSNSGVALLLNQVFLIGCAGLGATFNCLYKLNTHVNNGSYERKYDSSYWTQVIMGLMGGVIISEILPLNSLEGEMSSGLHDFDKPIAALMGGFSSDLIYRLLNRVLDMIGKLVDSGQNPTSSKGNNAAQPVPLPVSPAVVPSLASIAATAPSNMQGNPLANINSALSGGASVQSLQNALGSQLPSGVSGLLQGATGQALASYNDTQSDEALTTPGDGAIPHTVVPRATEAQEALPNVGLLTYMCEGQEGGPYHSRKLHVPSENSGVTVGRGYDLKQKVAAKVAQDLTAAGVPGPQANLLSGAVGLMGAQARQFIVTHQLQSFEISTECQIRLFEQTYIEMEADVRRICEKPDCVQRYGQVDWLNLNSKIRQVLVDLRYRGDYSPATRQNLQSFVAQNNLPEFSRVLMDQSLWQSVPPDRFSKRVAFLRDEPPFTTALS